MKRYFQKYGIVTDAILMRDKFTGAPRGFGFVCFEDKRVVESVLKDSHSLDGRNIDTKPAFAQANQPGGRGRSGGANGSSPIESCKIFVGGLALAVTETELNQYFAQFGTVTGSLVMYDRSTQRSRGFGFVSFDDKSAVAKVLATPDHIIMDKPVECKPAQSKSQRDRAPFSGRGGRFNNNASHGYGGGGGGGGYGGGGGGRGGRGGGYGGGRGGGGDW